MTAARTRTTTIKISKMIGTKLTVEVEKHHTTAPERLALSLKEEFDNYLKQS